MCADRAHERSFRIKRVCPSRLALRSLHLPCKLDGGAYGRRLSSVEIRLDFVVSLESRWHTEAGRVAWRARTLVCSAVPE